MPERARKNAALARILKSHGAPGVNGKASALV